MLGLGGCDDEVVPPSVDQAAVADAAGIDAIGCGPGGTSQCKDKCVNLGTDPGNCGKCGTKCVAGQVCSAGKCALSCHKGLTDCSGACANLLSDLANCGACGTKCAAGQVCSAGKCALSCQSGLTDCSGACANLQTDVANCGACANKCLAGHVCSAGKCALSCQSGLKDCSGVCVNLQSDLYNCGACANKCAAGQVCSVGKCALSCQSTLTNCSGTCANLQSDLSHCGACGNACKAGQVCSAGKCALTCQTSLTDCSGTCVNLLTDLAHCGACGNACKAGQVCKAGKCEVSCQAGLTDCSGTCANLQSDVANCGACGTACKGGEVCSAGKCALSCQKGLTDCSGTCVNLQSDFYHCGKCASQCAWGKYCCAGGCVDVTSDTKHCGGCGKACKAGELCTSGKCTAYGVTISAMGCRYVDIKNTGSLPLSTFKVTVDGSAVPVTAPAGGLKAGASGRLYLAYLVAKGQKVAVTSATASASQTQATDCPIQIEFAKFTDQGNDYMALIMTLKDLGADFKTRTGLAVKTTTVNKKFCTESIYQTFLDVAKADLTNVDLIYYHGHGPSYTGGANFKLPAAEEKNLYEWVNRGGVAVFDDCGGINYADLKTYFGVYAALNGSTGSSTTVSKFILKSDLYEKPYKYTTTTFSTVGTWSEGGQTGTTGGLKEIVRRGSSAFVSGKKVGNGWIAFVGGDWGCSLSCSHQCTDCCSKGTKVAHQLMLNFAYIASGRAKLIK